MSPEQVSGRPVTFRTDQFALGVVLYEMLTGRRAFHGDSAMDTLAAILKDEPVPIAELCPTLPPRLVTIVERCLAKRPENRYGSTRDLARDLAEARNLPPSTQQPVLPLSQPVPVSPNSDPVTPKPIRYRGIVTAAVLLIAALAGVGYAFYMRAHRVGPGPAAFRQVAVLPFTCADPNDQVFCDGIMETLTIDLTQLSSFDPSLRVVSQQVLRRDLPPDKVRDPAMARSVLGATISITGDVTRRGSETVVTLTRIDANRSQPRSIGIADGQEAAMPRELVAVAATLLDVKLSRSIWASLLAWWEGGTFAVSASIDKHGTAVPQAYLAYLRGRGYLHGGKASADQAIAVLKQAVQADPGYVQAHAALCEAYWQKLEVELARAACLAALQIDSELVPVHLALIRNASSKEKGEAISRAENLVRLARFSSDVHTALGQAHLNNEDLPAAEAAYLEGLRDLPDDSQISGELCRLYLIWANKLGKPANKPMVEQARSACQQAARLTPDSTRVLNSLGSTLLLSELYEDAAVQYLHSMKVRPTSTAAANLGLYSYRRENYDEAATRYEQAIAGLGPSDPVPNRITAWQGLGAAYWAARAESGKWKNAYQNVVQLIRGYVETKQMTVETMDDSRMLGQLADAYSMLNQQAGAHAALEALEHRDVKDSQTMFAVASAYAQIDDRTRALQWLKRAVDAGYPCDQVTRSPFIKELRKDQKYQSVGCK